MEAVIRKVRDIEADERRALEHVIGQQLTENQQIIIQVVDLGNSRSDQLPEWCNVYEGLTEQEIDELESVIRERADLARPSA